MVWLTCLLHEFRLQFVVGKGGLNYVTVRRKQVPKYLDFKLKNKLIFSTNLDPECLEVRQQSLVVDEPLQAGRISNIIQFTDNKNW